MNIRTIPRCGCRSHGRGHSGKFDPLGRATSQDRIPQGGGPHLRIRSRRGATPQDLPLINVHHNDPAGGATLEDRIPRGGATPGDQIPRGGAHIVGSDPPVGGHTGGAASNSNILTNSNLYSNWLLGMNRGVVGQVLMPKNRMQKISCQCTFNMEKQLYILFVSYVLCKQPGNYSCNLVIFLLRQ